MQRYTFGDAAVTPHELSTQAAMEVMAAGGNAVDAAVAANAVLGVVAPQTCGVGGDLFALVIRPGLDKPLALNASGPAGARADAAELRGLSEVPGEHALSVTVPGCVQGWSELLLECGRIPFSDILVPAIRLASEGFPADPELAHALHDRFDEMAAQSASDGLFPRGSPPRAGERLTRPGLARTLSEIAADGASAFYGGMAGRSISEATGGRITVEDLTAYRASWVEPLGLELFGRTAWTVPPNSQGYVTLAALWIFSQLDAPPDPADPHYHHALIEACRAAAYDRDTVLSDPAFSPLSAEELIEPSRLEPRAAAIDTRRAGTWTAPEGRGAGTGFIAVVDRDGIGISLIQSNYRGIGSGIGAGAAGFFLHNRGAGFSLVPDNNNFLAPGKRPRHTLAPMLWTDQGRLSLLLGTRGGNQQPQLLAQVAAHLLHAGLTEAAAQQAPRWTLEPAGAGESSAVLLESDLADLIGEDLIKRGHLTVRRSRLEGHFGPVGVVTVDRTGLRAAAADPRVPSAGVAAR